MKNILTICGNSIADLEAGLAEAKKAYAAGYTYGVGGTSIDEVETALTQAKAYCGCDCKKPKVKAKPVAAKATCSASTKVEMDMDDDLIQSIIADIVANL